MPDTMRRWLRACVVATALLPASRAAAQDIPELERRVDAAVVLRNQATVALNAYRARAIAPRQFPDTVALVDGTLRVVTSDEFLPMVRAAAGKADVFIRERAGAQSAKLRGLVFAVWTDSLRRSQQGLIIGEQVGSRESNEQYVAASVAAVTAAFEGRLQWMLASSGKAKVAEWLSGELPIDTLTNADWRAIRLELISSRTTITRRCFAGDIEACKVTLGLVPEADPATAWYDSATRRSFIVAARKLDKFDQIVSARCVAGNDHDCIALIRTENALAQWWTPPGTRRARAALVQQAIAMGGPGSLERFVASDDSVGHVISAMAKVPLDSVVSQWQRHAHDGGIQSESATPVIAMTAIGWILAMGAISLRSPRWR